MDVKFDMREWRKTFERYVSLRTSKTRQEITQQKALDFAIKAFQALPPTDKSRIQSELLAGNLLLKLTVQRLQAKGVVLKGLPSVRVRGKHGGKRMISGVDQLISQYSKKLLRSRVKSSGYHRVAFLLLAQKLGSTRKISINPRSFLMRTNVQKWQSRTNDTYVLNAVARGMDCPSTHEARDAALAASQADMEVYIQRKLDTTRKSAGFK